MFLGVGRLQVPTGNEIIERGDTGRDRMAARDALHRRQPRKRQEIRQGVHTNVGVKQHVQLLLCNPFLEGGQRLLRGQGYYCLRSQLLQ